MQRNDEIELKWMLHQADYHRLLEHLNQAFGPGDRLQQSNHFYDTPDRRLFAAKVNLRLRCENDHWIVTCKQKVATAQQGLHHHSEWEQALPDASNADQALAAAIAAGLPETVTHALQGAMPKRLGGFDNLRFDWRQQHEHVSLDHTNFSQRVDYELEVETNDPTASTTAWNQRMADLSIAASPSQTTKFARFLQIM